MNLVDRLKIDEELIKFCKIHLLTCEEIKSLRENQDWRLEVKINIEYDLAYDKLYLGSWNAVPEEHRRMFQILSFLKAFCIVRDQESVDLDHLLKALYILDVAIICGAGLEQCELMTEFANLLHNITGMLTHCSILILTRIFSVLVEKFPPEPIEIITNEDQSPDQCDILSLDQPSEELFWTNHFHLHQPAKLQNCISDWSALSKWKDLNYFMKLAGFRSVPIELGKKYDNDDWSQGMFRFGEFIKEFMTGKQSINKLGYLAQHDLFDQIPQLRKDFDVPEYCAIGTGETIMKSWIGPAGTISSMHTDDKHNLFCQVMGEKLIIIASPKDAVNLYPHEGLLNNTSQVDPESINLEEFPLAQKVKFYKVILKAGEMLYIPKLWFHYVRSLSPSINISFWFDCD